MNKTILIIVAAVIVVGGAAWYLMGRSGQNTPASDQNSAARESATGKATGKMSLKSLLGSGTSQQCTFSDTAGGTTSSGTVYIAGGKMRGDFTSTASGRTTNGHMIVMNDTSYIWTDGTTQGFKTSTNASASSQTGQSIDVNKEGDYSCSAWSTNASEFTLPQNVTFVDINAMIPAIPGGLPTGR